MTQFTYSEEIFSDMHKDAYGFRPRSHEFYDATPARKQEIWDSVYADVLAEIDREAQREAADLKEFESQINLRIALGAGDRETALRWMTQGEEFYNEQCVEHWVWNQGILFTDTGRALVKELMNIVTFKEWEAA